MNDRYECDPSHKHAETSTCYHKHKCRCDACRTAVNRRQRERIRLKAYGRFEGRVDPLGTRRRIQALQVTGWRLADIADVAGMSFRDISRVQRNVSWITPETRDRIAHAFDVLVRKGVGPSSLAASVAKGRGWLSPYAWDDLDTDSAPVKTKREEPGKFDEMAVELAIAGDPVTLNYKEREEVVRRLNQLRWTDTRIAKHIGSDPEVTNRIRRRLNLPTWGYQERAADYVSDSRMNPT